VLYSSQFISPRTHPIVFCIVDTYCVASIFISSSPLSYLLFIIIIIIVVTMFLLKVNKRN